MLKNTQYLTLTLITKIVIPILGIFGCLSPAGAIELVNTLSIPGESIDLTPLNGGSGGANINRVGFFSDLYYDRSHNVYYGLGDRGPGGGVISYETRLQKFSLDVNPNTGAISNFNILETIPFTKNGQAFNGLNPSLLNGTVSNLGQSFDPEGLVVAGNGNFYISDEYGPSVYEFNPQGEFIRAFTTPGNIIPQDAQGNNNYVDGRPTITTGRQDNRGFEGLTITPDGSSLLAVLQDPLVNEGTSNDGRRSRNVRIVKFDIATGTSTAQYIYQLESIVDINARIPGTADDFGQNAQGRNIGLSSIMALSDSEFLVLERDNRGFGVDGLLGLTGNTPITPSPVGSKRIYKISLAGATDVKDISLAGTNTLPNGVNPVTKSLFLDIADSISPSNPGDWTQIAEKMEGLTIGTQLADGSFSLLIGTDNDFSVTQDGSSTQFNICSNATGSSVSKIALDGQCPSGQQLIPGFLYAFQVSPQEIGQQVPEPRSLAALGLVVLSLIGRRRPG